MNHNVGNSVIMDLTGGLRKVCLVPVSHIIIEYKHEHNIRCTSASDMLCVNYEKTHQKMWKCAEDSNGGKSP